MRILLFILMVVLEAVTLHSQGEISIAGRLFESDEVTPISFATVVLSMESGKEELTAGAFSDETGRFVIYTDRRGKGLITVSYIGYEDLEVPVLIGQKNNHFDLGKLSLQLSATELEQVTVTAKQATVARSLDKKSFDLSDQLSQLGGSVADAMKALPGIQIDQEGKVLLRGSDKVLILINGQQSGMTGFGNQRGLNNIPAANIERIEIINNPSAAYDAAGMAGIINIIYKKEKEQGFNGEAGFTLGVGELTTRRASLPTKLGRYSQNAKYIPNISLNQRGERLNSFFQGEVIQQRSLPNNEFTTRRYQDGAETVSQVPENRTQTHYVLQGGMEYKISDRDQLRFSSIFDYENHRDTAQVPYIDLKTNQRYRYWHWSEQETTGYLGVRLDYEHLFNQPGHVLDFNAQYGRGWEDESYFLNDSSAIRLAQDMTHIIATENITTLQTDYQKPLKNGRLEAGVKFQIRTIPVTYEIDRGEQSVIYEGLGDWSDWGENIYSAYTNYLLEKPNYDIEAGLRVEQTEVFYDISPENTFYPSNDAYDYLEFFPNVRLTLRVSPENSISLFYNRRVDRPGEPQLRIFPKYDDPELLKVGNPYLRPQFTQTFELAYKRLWENGSIFFSTYHRIIDNPFTRVYSIDSSDPNYSIVNKIYQNVGSGANTGIEVLLAQNIAKYWKMSSSINWYSNLIKGLESELLFPFRRPFTIPRTVDQTWEIKVSNQFKISEQTQLQLTSLYMAPKNIPQGRQLSRSSVDLGFKQVVWGGKAEVLLSFTDIFNDFGLRQEIEEADFTAVYENYFETQVLRLGIKYKW